MNKKNILLIGLIILIISTAGYIWFGIDAYNNYKFIGKHLVENDVKVLMTSNLAIIAVCVIGLITNTIFGLVTFYIATEHFDLNKRVKKLEEKQKALN